MFTNANSRNFTLRSSSPMIDAGAFLTTVTSTTASGRTAFIVDDAAYFYDGWGIPGETGDKIKTEHGQVTTIQTIDYDTHTITVSPAINIVNGEGVALNYFGSAPDIGAFEYTVPGDFDGNGCVDIADLAMFVELWLQCNDPQNPDCEFLF